MNSSIKQLENILSDNISGSSEILLKINNLLKKNCRNRSFIEDSIKKFKKHFSHFSAIKYYLDRIEKLVALKDEKAFYAFINNFEEEENNLYKKIFNNALPYLKNINTVLTLSNSNTLYYFFKLWKAQNKKLKIIVCESRPMFEGRILTKNLLKEKIKVQLITEAEASIYIPKVDAVIIGADSVLEDRNVVNKTGSNALAIICKYYKKPFFVVAAKSKFIRKKSFTSPPYNSNEIWKFNARNLTVENYYFELVGKKLITKMFTD